MPLVERCDDRSMAITPQDLYFEARLAFVSQPDVRIAIRDAPHGGLRVQCERAGRLPRRYPGPRLRRDVFSMRAEELLPVRPCVIEDGGRPTLRGEAYINAEMLLAGERWMARDLAEQLFTRFLSSMAEGS